MTNTNTTFTLQIHSGIKVTMLCSPDGRAWETHDESIFEQTCQAVLSVIGDKYECRAYGVDVDETEEGFEYYSSLAMLGVQPKGRYGKACPELTGTIIHINADKKRSVVIYTDGGCPVPNGVAASAYIAQYNGKERSRVVSFTQGTNQRAELIAIGIALSDLKAPCQVQIITDSKSAIGWLTGEWKRKDANIRAICTEIDRVIAEVGHTVSYQWVKGHLGNEINERVDALCTAAIQKAKGN